MKKLNRIVTVLIVAVFMVTSYSANAQKSKTTYNGDMQSLKKIIDLSQIGTNSTVLEYKSGENKIMSFDIKKDKNGLTTFLPNFNNTPFDKVRVELYNGKTLVAEYLDDKKGGPNSFDNFITYENEIPFTTYINAKEELWPILAYVVLCCVQAEVAYSQESGWSGSLGFDCDCFGKTASSSTKNIMIKGKKYAITSMKFIPLNQTKIALSKSSAFDKISISLK